MFIFKSLDEIDLEKLKEEIENERKFVKDVLSGKIYVEKKKLFETVLFIVESPNKAKTIANFFGKPSVRNIENLNIYEVSIGNKHLIITASVGHIVDLTTENIGLFGIENKGNIFIPYYNTIKKCLDCGRQFTEYGENKTCPYCGSTRINDSYDRIKALQRLAEEVDYVVIGTDPDYEGEAIAFFLYLLLKPFNSRIYRGEFHEVTRHAILDALNNLREINLNMVKAQIVRRIEDRWLGFSLSQILQNKFNMTWLSAGRVQTPVLGWVIQRFNERKQSTSYIYYLVLDNGQSIIIDTDIKDPKVARDIEKKLRNKKIEVKSYEEFEDQLNPLPPYITSTILQDANNIFKLGVTKIMNILQDLFEQGLITYHRTDSIRVSSAGIQVAKEYITNKYGPDYFVPRSWGEGGAHEAIRPTRPIDTEELKKAIEEGEIEVFIDMTWYHYTIYDLIFKRFIQSQMSPVIVRKFREKIYIPILEKEIEEEGILDVVKDGWNLVDNFYINVNKKIPIKENYTIYYVKKKKVPKVRLYSQSDIINLMKTKGIGRPSTYATIVSKLLERRYVLDIKNNLIPTELGIKVYRFLEDNFGRNVSEEKTAELEKVMEEVEEGKADYLKVLQDLYKETEEIIERSKNI